MQHQESAPTPLSAERSRQERLAAEERNNQRMDALRAEADAHTDAPSDITITYNRKFDRDEEGIHISPNEFIFDPLTIEQKESLAEYEAAEAAKIEARLNTETTNPKDGVSDSTEKPTPTPKRGKKSTEVDKTTKQEATSEKETGKEKKERIKPEKSWLKRIGEAAITNFLTIRKVGIVDFVTDKVDTARENIASTFETFTSSLSERYAKARKSLEELSGKSEEAAKKLLSNRAEALKRRAARLEKFVADRESNKARRKENRANRLKPYEQSADKEAEAINRRAAARRLGKRGTARVIGTVEPETFI